MAALMKVYYTKDGVKIYESANTHPGSLTKSLCVYKNNKRINFRFERTNIMSKRKAFKSALIFIRENSRPYYDPITKWNLQ